jgi:hypothetical protein
MLFRRHSETPLTVQSTIRAVVLERIAALLAELAADYGVVARVNVHLGRARAELNRNNLDEAQAYIWDALDQFGPVQESAT